MYTKEIIEEWKQHRNDTQYKSMFVCNKKEFGSIYEQTKDCDDIAYISIECTDECAKFADISHDNEHYAIASNVLNIEFDDVEHDIYYPNDKTKLLAKAITPEIAYEIYKFATYNIGKHFIIHCRAGKSRSQGVYQALNYIFAESGMYKQNDINKINPAVSPNIKVKSEIIRIWYEHN